MTKSKVKKSDSISLENVKANFDKGKNLEREVSQSGRKKIYNKEFNKKERGKIRRKIRSFERSLLAKDRSNEEKEKVLKEFIDFYKKHWLINDLKIENFTNSRKVSKEEKEKYFEKNRQMPYYSICESLLNYVKSVIS